MDLDGVVSPLPPRDVEDPEEKFRISAGHMTWPGALYRMHVDKRLPTWAVQLDAVYDVVWATSWQTDVLKCVAWPLDLPEWPVLTWPLSGPVAHRFGQGRVRFKAQSIHAHLQADPRPFAWADDHLARRTPPRPIHELGLSYLLIRPRPLTGLIPEHVEQLLTFADQLLAHAPRQHSSSMSSGCPSTPYG
jgi:hypothetical protein